MPSLKRTGRVRPRTAQAEEKPPLCNLCGLSCYILDHVNCCSPSGLVNAQVRGGYHSTPGNGPGGTLDDGECYSFALCEWCLDWLFEQFTVPVVVGSYFGDPDPGPWSPARERVARDDWRKDKALFQREYERRNAARAARAQK